MVRGADSPYQDGRTMVVDVFGSDGLVAPLMDLAATGFGMVAARTWGDDALAEELQESWDRYFGAPQWSDDASTLSYTGPLLPLVVQNAFPLLARTGDSERNLPVDALTAWDPARFDHPYIASVSDEAAFVNQAFYDPETDELILTLNGGFATSEPASVAVANLDPSLRYAVTRNGEPFEQVAWDGELLVIRTTPLRYQMDSYIVGVAPPASEPPPPEQEQGCACNGSASAAGLFPLLGLALALRRRTR